MLSWNSSSGHLTLIGVVLATTTAPVLALDKERVLLTTTWLAVATITEIGMRVLDLLSDLNAVSTEILLAEQVPPQPGTGPPKLFLEIGVLHRPGVASTINLFKTAGGIGLDVAGEDAQDGNVAAAAVWHGTRSTDRGDTMASITVEKLCTKPSAALAAAVTRLVGAQVTGTSKSCVCFGL